MNACKRPQGRENASGQVAIGFSFEPDWLSRWREFCRPITERSKAKPIQSRITFDTQLKIALMEIRNVRIPPTWTAYDIGVPGSSSLLATFIQKQTVNALNS